MIVTRYGVLIPLIGLLMLVSEGDMVCEKSQSTFSVPGNIYLSGIFDLHSGENCSIPFDTGIQQATAALAVIKLLQEVDFLPGIRVGISLYDSCSSATEAQKQIATAKLESDCMDSILLGVLTTPAIHKSFQPLANSLALSTITTSNPYYSPFLFDVAASLLVQLGWTRIDVVLSEDSLLLDSFEDATAQKRICVEARRLLSEDIESELSGKIVVIHETTNLRNFLRNKISSRAEVIFLPIQITEQITVRSEEMVNYLTTLLPSRLFGSTLCFPHHIADNESAEIPISPKDFLQSESYIIQPSYHTVKLGLQDENSTSTNKTSEEATDIFTNSLATPLFVQTAADVIQVFNSIKSNIEAMCPQALDGKSLCTNLKILKNSVVTGTILQSEKKMSSVLDAIELESEGFEMFRVVKNDLNRDEPTIVGSYSIIDGNWTWLLVDENITGAVLCRQDPANITSGQDCSECSNFKEIYRKRMEEIHLAETFVNSIEWKSELWVAVVITISIVGIICDLAIIIFITVRICKQDILEGNPTFSFLLLFAIILTYISSLPFSFNIVSDNPLYSGIACNMRILGASLSYSFIFSIMLARSFMIASCDHDGGFMSHINGYLQTIVCFFIVMVQLALSFQFGALNWKYLTTENCISLTHGYLFIFILSYDMFLLLLLALTAPFIMRSKRNYNEGSFFAVASLFCILAWCSWVTCFTILGEKWQDMIISCGLCATSTIILVTVFIPRTYLMVTGIVKDHLASTLPSLAYASSSSVIDVINYRSTQALYDSVNTHSAPKGQLNPNFYSDRPGTPSTSKMDSIQRIEHRVSENTYERYDTPTSPLNVTRF